MIYIKKGVVTAQELLNNPHKTLELFNKAEARLKRFAHGDFILTPFEQELMVSELMAVYHNKTSVYLDNVDAYVKKAEKMLQNKQTMNDEEFYLLIDYTMNSMAMAQKTLPNDYQELVKNPLFFSKYKEILEVISLKDFYDSKKGKLDGKKIANMVLETGTELEGTYRYMLPEMLLIGSPYSKFTYLSGLYNITGVYVSYADNAAIKPKEYVEFGYHYGMEGVLNNDKNVVHVEKVMDNWVEMGEDLFDRNFAIDFLMSLNGKQKFEY